MFKITLIIESPLTRESESMVYQFDPVTLNQAKWNAAFPAVKTKLDELVLRSTPKEPLTW